jgi:hypothetical protein
MHRHDELIAALADGSIDPERVAEAEAMVKSDPEAAALLRLHRDALDAVAGAGPALMTTAERSLVRGAVADALGVEDGVPAVAAAGRGVRWNSLLTAAVAVAAFLAFMPLAGMLTPGTVGFTTDFDEAMRFAEQSETPGADLADVSDPILSFGDDGGTVDDTFDSSGAGAPGGTVVIEPPPAESEATTTTEAATTSTEAATTTTSEVAEEEPDILAALETEIAGFEEMYDSAEAADDEGTCVLEARTILAEDATVSDADTLYAFQVTRGDGSTVVVFFLRDAEDAVVLVAVFDAGECVLLS